MEPRILIVGSVNSDLVLRVSRQPLAGESVIAKNSYRIAGGKGANQAVAVARLGAHAAFAGRVGGDPEGEILTNCLKAEGVCTNFLKSGLRSTGLAVITIDDQGQNSIVVAAGANDEVCEDDIRSVLRTGSFDALMLQLEIPVEAVLAASRLAAARDLPVIFDPGPARAFPLERLEGIHILSPNETETLALTGVRVETLREAEAAAAILLQRSRARAVVLKLGARGALLHECNGSYLHLPAYAIKAIDTTAAGDAFTAAMTVEYIRSRNLRKAIDVGNAAGALAAMRLGAQPSLPTAAAIEEFFASRGECVH